MSRISCYKCDWDDVTLKKKMWAKFILDMYIKKNISAFKYMHIEKFNVISVNSYLKVFHLFRFRLN